MNLNRVEIPKTHNIKVEPECFEAISKGNKNFEICQLDRSSKTGDRVILKEFDRNTFTGREVVAEITFITNYEQKKGYVVFAFRKYSVANRKDAGKV